MIDARKPIALAVGLPDVVHGWLTRHEAAVALSSYRARRMIVHTVRSRGSRSYAIGQRVGIERVITTATYPRAANPPTWRPQ